MSKKSRRLLGPTRPEPFRLACFGLAVRSDDPANSGGRFQPLSPASEMRVTRLDAGDTARRSGEADIPPTGCVARAGYTARISARCCNAYLPLALAVLNQESTAIVRQEMEPDRALELLLPQLQPPTFVTQRAGQGYIRPARGSCSTWSDRQDRLPWGSAHP